MYNFFITKENKIGDKVRIIDTDYNHIKNVLRMKEGDEFLVSLDGASHLCTIESLTDTEIIAVITKENFQDTSLPVSITLFQGLPKSDKLELIIQKAVELGVDEITPVQMERCIVKLDDKKQDGKVSRWQAIAESAAKQSKRTCIPTVNAPLSFNKMLEKAKTYDLFIVPYESENGMQSTKDTLSKIKSGHKIGVLIGPEGGFSQKEITLAKEQGAKIVSLGKRILRTETAAMTALSMIMLYAEMKL
ncbi:MAG: 16S rRNA (uracil(1498)-N(3))-methyltransferase [Clostridia bacterium]|nr:16S rRNA (uracil(1498)-N(3))-methyltransferase [Clostridia bacterium]